MAAISRIRFNPVTKEIEIEGSEDFVKTYFSKIQKILSEPAEVAAKGPAARSKSAAMVKETVKKGAKREKVVKKAVKKTTNFDSVMAIIKKSKKGVTTTDLMKKTGLTQRQIWGIIYQAEKDGKIAKVKRGVYISAVSEETPSMPGNTIATTSQTQTEE
jgi:hypothetical protein